MSIHDEKLVDIKAVNNIMTMIQIVLNGDKDGDAIQKGMTDIVIARSKLNFDERLCLIEGITSLPPPHNAYIIVCMEYLEAFRAQLDRFESGEPTSELGNIARVYVFRFGAGGRRYADWCIANMKHPQAQAILKMAIQDIETRIYKK